jgi:hypothetical protein
MQRRCKTCGVRRHQNAKLVALTCLVFPKLWCGQSTTSKCKECHHWFLFRCIYLILIYLRDVCHSDMHAHKKIKCFTLTLYSYIHTLENKLKNFKIQIQVVTNLILKLLESKFNNFEIKINTFDFLNLHFHNQNYHFRKSKLFEIYSFKIKSHTFKNQCSPHVKSNFALIDIHTSKYKIHSFLI